MTIMWHKPKGLLCTHSDELGMETVYDRLRASLPARLQYEYFAIGRSSQYFFVRLRCVLICLLRHALYFLAIILSAHLLFVSCLHPYLTFTSLRAGIRMPYYDLAYDRITLLLIAL